VLRPPTGTPTPTADSGESRRCYAFSERPADPQIFMLAAADDSGLRITEQSDQIERREVPAASVPLVAQLDTTMPPLLGQGLDARDLGSDSTQSRPRPLSPAEQHRGGKFSSQVEKDGAVSRSGSKQGSSPSLSCDEVFDEELISRHLVQEPVLGV
jgi:hypothetical protein